MLWLLNTFPTWVFHGILFIGVMALFVTAVTSKIPVVSAYSLELRVVSLLMIIAGLMLEGAISLQKDYFLKEAALKEKLHIAETNAANAVTKVVEQIVYRDKVIVTQGTNVVTYIDKWHDAIDNNCTLSTEAINVHNAAAKSPVVTEAIK